MICDSTWRWELLGGVFKMLASYRSYGASWSIFGELPCTGPGPTTHVAHDIRDLVEEVLVVVPKMDHRKVVLQYPLNPNPQITEPLTLDNDREEHSSEHCPWWQPQVPVQPIIGCCCSGVDI